MPTLTDRQIAGAVQAAGWPRDQWTTAVAVILAESGGRSDVVNSIGASGLMQILRSAHSKLFTRYNYADPVDNCRMGLIVWQEAGKSWHPWEAYTNGSYRQFLKRAAAATGNPAAAPSGSAVGSPSTSAQAAGFPSTSSNSWARIGWFVSGAVLLLIGALFITKLDSVIPAGRVIKTVRAVAK